MFLVRLALVVLVLLFLVLAIGDYIQQDNADPENVFAKIEPGNRVFVKWTEAMPVNVEGQAAVLIDRNHIKAILS